MTEKYIKTIGEDKEESGFFNKKTKTLILPIVLGKYESDYKKIKASLERTIFISGIEYEEKKNFNKHIFYLKINSYIQLTRIVPIIKDMYTDVNVEINISKNCENFFD